MKDIEFKIINIEDMPEEKRKRHSPYRELFNKIPIDMVMEINLDNSKSSYSNIRASFHRLKRNGELKNFKMIKRDNLLFIIHTEKEI
jgi:hypothetical protein